MAKLRNFIWSAQAYVNHFNLLDTLDLSDDKFLEAMRILSSFHYSRSNMYKAFCDLRGFSPNSFKNCQINEIPFLPVSFFKNHNLISIPDNNVIKIANSSGTTSSATSRIHLDIQTSNLMERRLLMEASRSIGNERRPLFVCGSKISVGGRSFQAKMAAIAGLLKFGRPIRFLLTDSGDICSEAVSELISIKNSSALIVGSTVDIWSSLLGRLEDGIGNNPDLKIIHGGGWKSSSGSVANSDFNERCFKVFGTEECINFYGMVEQLGAVSYSCQQGNLHVGASSRFLIRDMNTGASLDYGEKGLVQCMSVIPLSYPGHSALTDDLGYLLPAESCHCGTSGDVFHFVGRVNGADSRGCGSV